jgi:hypothetical protein
MIGKEMMPPLKLKGRDAKKDLLRIHGFMRKLIIKFFSWSYKSNKPIDDDGNVFKRCLGCI